MRARIVGLLIGLMVCVVLALGVPLGASLSRNVQQAVYVDRLGDAARLASVAQRAISESDLSALEADARRYDDVYGISVALLDRRGRTVLTSGGPLDVDRGGRERIEVALSGRRGEIPASVAPWDDSALVVAEPVVVGGDVTGVVVTASPTVRLRADVARDWLVIGAAMALALAVCAGVAGRVAGWVLRPVHRLDTATQAIATGRLGTRVEADAGPPELRRLADAFNEMAANVEGLIEAQRTFVADASHQLRNPLSALLLRLEEVAVALPPGYEDRLDPTRREGHRLALVLGELLELARAEHVSPAPAPVDVAGLLCDRVEAWRVLAGRTGVRLAAEAPRGVLAYADPTGLSSALDAVVDNAIKFSPDGGTVRLTGRHEGDGAEVVLEVWDEGPGLDDEELERVGDRFWRSPRDQNVPGSGLGLSIARSLLAAGGGTLAVSRAEGGPAEGGSAEGPGAGLRVSLRVPAATAAHAGALRSPRPRAAPTQRWVSR